MPPPARLFLTILISYNPCRDTAQCQSGRESDNYTFPSPSVSALEGWDAGLKIFKLDAVDDLGVVHFHVFAEHRDKLSAGHFRKAFVVHIVLANSV